MKGGTAAKRRIIFWAAATVSALCIALLVVFAVLVATGDESLKALGATTLVFAAFCALVFSPAWIEGSWFRVWVAILGVVATLGGLVLLIVGIGVVVLPIGLLFLALAWTPDSWSARRILAWAIIAPAIALMLMGVVAGIGSLIEAGQRE